MKAIVVGRHVPSGKEGIEIVGNENSEGVPQPWPIMFPATVEECKIAVEALLDKANEKECHILFQAVPVQLGVAVTQMVHGSFWWAKNLIGAIVNIPGPRLTAVNQTFASDDSHAIGAIEAAVRFANSRAKVEVLDTYQVKVSVDPFIPFRFSHIQWFSGETSNWSIRGFFARFGLPMEWLDNDDDINTAPEVNEGCEVSIAVDGITHSDIIIDGKNISIRAVSLPANFKERFNANMVVGDKAGNIDKLVSIINEVVDHEAGC